MSKELKTVLKLVEGDMFNRRKIESLEVLNKAMTDAIDWSLAHCPVCSVKPGMPTLCRQCLVLRASKGGSRHEYYFED